MIVSAARSYRENNPGIGCVKLHMILRKVFTDIDDFPGRDAFTDLLKQNDLMVRMKRRKRYKTTYSNHNYRKYPNLIKDIVASRPNQIWVSDITYIETAEGVCYLSLITDAYSRKIVGWALGETLEAIYPINALNMALSGLNGTKERLIHHSDRGCQYCSYAYVALLKEYGIDISMTQSGDPLENAIAERTNGILKSEWLYKMEIKTKHECKALIDRIILFYNNERPHMSIDYLTPSEAHSTTGVLERRWKNQYIKKENKENKELRCIDRFTVLKSDEQRICQPF